MRNSNYSEKRPYKSHFKEGYITAANYIAELIFINRADAFKTNIPQYFWRQKNKYYSQYVGQVIAASKLLKQYSAEVIIAALKDPRGKKILKLQDSRLPFLLREYHAKFKDRQRVFEKTEDEDYATKQEDIVRKNKKKTLGDIL